MAEADCEKEKAVPVDPRATEERAWTNVPLFQ